jgi:hypothetical protein
LPERLQPTLTTYQIIVTIVSATNGYRPLKADTRNVGYYLAVFVSVAGTGVYHSHIVDWDHLDTQGLRHWIVARWRLCLV